MIDDYLLPNSVLNRKSAPLLDHNGLGSGSDRPLTHPKELPAGTARDGCLT